MVSTDSHGFARKTKHCDLYSFTLSIVAFDNVLYFVDSGSSIKSENYPSRCGRNRSRIIHETALILITKRHFFLSSPDSPHDFAFILNQEEEPVPVYMESLPLTTGDSLIVRKGRQFDGYRQWSQTNAAGSGAIQSFGISIQNWKLGGRS